MKRNLRLSTLALTGVMLTSAMPVTTFANDVQSEVESEAIDEAISEEISVIEENVENSSTTTSAAVKMEVRKSTSLFSGGSGTIADPYQISTKEDILELGWYTAGYVALPEGVTKEYLASANYIQMNDIDMEQDTNFVPICLNSSIPFSGEFDGNGYEIQNLYRAYITRAIDTKAEGLFSNTNTAELKNINLVNPLFEMNTGIAHNNIGGLVGYAYNSKIDNCSVVATENYSKIKTTNSSNVGGLVGTADGGTIIQNSNAKISVSGINSVGGIVGNTINAQILSSFYKGDVSGAAYVGGIAGGNSTSTDVDIKYCYNEGSVTGNSYVGGILGYMVKNTDGTRVIANNYSHCTIKSNTNTGGIVGYVYITGSSTSKRNITITNNFADNDIYVNGSNSGGIVGNLYSNHVNHTTTVTDNISFSRIQPTGIVVNTGSIVGTNASKATAARNYVSFAAEISGNNGHNTWANIAYQKDLISKEWWDNILLINDSNAFDTSLVSQGYLPKLYAMGTTTYVPEQPDLEFIGNHVPTAGDVVYEQSSLENQEMPIETYGVKLTSLEVLNENGDYQKLVSGTDYQVSTNGVILKSALLETLPIGKTKVRLVFNSGQTIFAYIEVVEGIPAPPTIIGSKTYDLQYDGLTARYNFDKSTIETGLTINKVRDVTNNNVLDTSYFKFVNSGSSAYFRINEDYFLENGIEPDALVEFEITYSNKAKDTVYINYIY